MHTHRPREFSGPKSLRSGEEQIQARIQAKLKEAGVRNWQLWEESLLSMWQEAIDMGCSQQLAREKLDETLRGVVTYLHLDLAVTEQRRMIASLFDHMSREIKTHVRESEGELEAPLTKEERRQHDRQRERDDSARIQVNEDRARGRHERNMRQHRVNKAGNTTMGIQETF
ncbi:hypothetical protein AUJ46_02930 [Candidatus Peregrinibacteria bacterium CG1_02_54_53]|nr:MAG: hypothetical protein AUJ46_02930 [Candidatus Peregrinibacteria bacterium CG1_02_54_53]